MKTILIITRDPLVNFRQMRNADGITDDGAFRFVINDTSCKPDFVVIKEKGLRVPTVFDVPRSHTILLTGEPYSILCYPEKFCAQFGTVLACQPQIKPIPGTNVIHTQAILTWFVGATFEADGTNRFPMNYTDISNARPKKTKDISVISSNKAFSRGHVDRLRFMEKLVNRYGDRIDVFGRGNRGFADKWEVLAPYKYHIVIENSTGDYYWTEKIADCYLAGTFPIYHGCTNIGRFFPEKSYVPVDIRNFDRTAEVIDSILASRLYEERANELALCKQLVLDRYNMFNFIAEICRGIEDNNATGPTLINPASKYFSWHNMYLYTVGRNYYKAVNWLAEK